MKTTEINITAEDMVLLMSCLHLGIEVTQIGIDDAVKNFKLNDAADGVALLHRIDNLFNKLNVAFNE